MSLEAAWQTDFVLTAALFRTLASRRAEMQPDGFSERCVVVVVDVVIVRGEAEGL